MRASETLIIESRRGYRRDTFPAASWMSEDGLLRAVAQADRIDLITRQQYRNFTLELEWKGYVRYSCNLFQGD